MKAPNTQLDEFLTYHLLARKFAHQNHDLIDYVAENDANSISPITKNVCAKLTIALSDKIDETCSMLGVSKRSFIETALVEALQRTDSLFDEIDPFGLMFEPEYQGDDSK